MSDKEKQNIQVNISSPNKRTKKKLKNENPLLTELVRLGSRGSYPLFFQSWIEEAFFDLEGPQPLTIDEKSMVSQILKDLKKHKTLARQREALLALKKNDRKIFVRAFMKMVETKILDSGVQIQ
jgi:hypothetical protein